MPCPRRRGPACALAEQSFTLCCSSLLPPSCQPSLTRLRALTRLRPTKTKPAFPLTSTPLTEPCSRQASYRVRVQFDEGRPSLLLTNSENAKTAVQGRPAVTQDSGAAPTIPIAGTLFLRSTEDPVGTDAERHRSKTGHAQYHETKRDWQAALRMYRYADAGRKEVLLLFQRRRPRGLWETSEFQLFLQRP